MNEEATKKELFINSTSHIKKKGSEKKRALNFFSRRIPKNQKPRNSFRRSIPLLATVFLLGLSFLLKISS